LYKPQTEEEYIKATKKPKLPQHNIGTSVFSLSISFSVFNFQFLFTFSLSKTIKQKNKHGSVTDTVSLSFPFFFFRVSLFVGLSGFRNNNIEEQKKT
jgi:hypothetical protein